MFLPVRGDPRGLSPTLSLFTVLVLLLSLAVPSTAAGQGWSGMDAARLDSTTTPTAPASGTLAEHLAQLAAAGTAEKGVTTDPVGDTFGSMTPKIDVTEMTADVAMDFAVLTFRFSSPVSPGDSGAPNALVGYIDLDMDQNGATGTAPFVDNFNPAGPLSGLGAESTINLFSYDSADGSADFIRTSDSAILGRTPVLFAGSRMAVLLDAGLLDGDDAAIDIAAVFGTTVEPTDVVPNAGSVPTDTSVVLQGGRFRISVDWRFAPAFPTYRPARVSVFRTGDSANLYFRNPDNLEFLIKVIDGCTVNDRYWVFFAGATTVDFIVSVEDLATRQLIQYFNPQGHPANAITDTEAFATCP